MYTLLSYNSYAFFIFFRRLIEFGTFKAPLVPNFDGRGPGECCIAIQIRFDMEDTDH